MTAVDRLIESPRVAPEWSRPAPSRTWADRLTQIATGLTVAGLAGVAGSISFSHMAELARAHGQLAWRSVAFPISVDGLELVASLYILSQHRAGRRAGLLPWAALIVGTAASLAANVAVGGHDLIGRALAGWPAVALLVSIKLLFAMFEDRSREDRRSVRASQRTDHDRHLVPGTVRGTDPGRAGPSAMLFPQSAIASTQIRSGSEPSRIAADGRSVDDTSPRISALADARPVDVRAVADLLPAARAACASLASIGRPLSREALANQMRKDGHPVSNARLSLLLKTLRTEEATTDADGEPDRLLERQVEHPALPYRDARYRS